MELRGAVTVQDRDRHGPLVRAPEREAERQRQQQREQEDPEQELGLPQDAADLRARQFEQR